MPTNVLMDWLCKTNQLAGVPLASSMVDHLTSETTRSFGLETVISTVSCVESEVESIH